MAFESSKFMRVLCARSSAIIQNNISPRFKVTRPCFLLCLTALLRFFLLSRRVHKMSSAVPPCRSEGSVAAKQRRQCLEQLLQPHSSRSGNNIGAGKSRRPVVNSPRDGRLHAAKSLPRLLNRWSRFVSTACCVRWGVAVGTISASPRRQRR